MRLGENCVFSQPLFDFSNITQITWEITASLVDKYERRTTRTASTFVLAYPYGLPRRLFPTPILIPAGPVVQPRGQGWAAVQSYHAEQSKPEDKPGGQSNPGGTHAWALLYFLRLILPWGSPEGDGRPLFRNENNKKAPPKRCYLKRVTRIELAT